MDNSTFSHSTSARPSAPASTGSDTAEHVAASMTHWAAVDSARNTLHRARTAAHDAVDRLTTGASDLVDRIENKTHGLGEMPKRAWSYSRSTVQDYPVQTVVVSLLAGYAIARLLGMRSGR